MHDAQDKTAEEGGQGKVILLERGAYNGMDACVMRVNVLVHTCDQLIKFDAGVTLLLVRSGAQV
jgi:hypothetical protein